MEMKMEIEKIKKEENKEKLDDKDKVEKIKKEKSPEKTSKSVFTLCLQGLNPFWNQTKIQKIINPLAEENEIKYIFKPKKKAYCFVQFAKEEYKQKFFKKYENDLIIKNKKIRIKDCLEGKDLSGREKNQRKREEKSRKKFLKPRKIYEDIREKVTPFFNLKKSEQIIKKQEICYNVFKELAEKARKKKCAKYTIRQSWLKNKENDDKILQDIIYNHKKEFYRNKVEYTISKELETNKIKIGFILNIRENFHQVDNRDDLNNIHPYDYFVAKKTEKFLNDLILKNKDKLGEDFDAYNTTSHKGCFRYLLIRHSEKSKELIIKLVCKIEKEEIKELLVNSLKNIIEDLQTNEFKLVSFILETHNTISCSIPNLKENEILIKGDRNYIIDIMKDKKFKVPIGGFFQVHPELAENLYDKIIDHLKIDENTILLDICAGTGTFGIILGQFAKEVYFIECNKAACGVIQDNINLNFKDKKFMEKCKIFPEKIEDCMAQISSELSGKGMRVVAIVDPPRAGLHPKVIKSIRTFIGVNELVFISCAFKLAKENIINLCCEDSRNCKGPPFSPVSCTPFDIFPYTSHYETLLYLKRLYE